LAQAIWLKPFEVKALSSIRSNCACSSCEMPISWRSKRNALRSARACALAVAAIAAASEGAACGGPKQHRLAEVGLHEFPGIDSGELCCEDRFHDKCNIMWQQPEGGTPSCGATATCVLGMMGLDWNVGSLMFEAPWTKQIQQTWATGASQDQLVTLQKFAVEVKTTSRASLDSIRSVLLSEDTAIARVFALHLDMFLEGQYADHVFVLLKLQAGVRILQGHTGGMDLMDWLCSGKNYASLDPLDTNTTLNFLDHVRIFIDNGGLNGTGFDSLSYMDAWLFEEFPFNGDVNNTNGANYIGGFSWQEAAVKDSSRFVADSIQNVISGCPDPLKGT